MNSRGCLGHTLFPCGYCQEIASRSADGIENVPAIVANFDDLLLQNVPGAQAMLKPFPQQFASSF